MGFFDQAISQAQTQVVNSAKQQLPFSSEGVANQFQQLGQFGQNAITTKLNEIAAPALALVNQVAPFPNRKKITMYLTDRHGKLVKPEGGGFQNGYLFNLLINPSSFNIVLPPKQVNEIRTYGGWSIQHWYPNLGSISADGIIGNMLQRFNQDLKKTPQWDRFKQLMNVYNKNGIPFNGKLQKGKRDTGRGSTDREFNPTAVIIYDRVKYEGYFESFDYTEREDMPFTREYKFSFKVLNMIDVRDIVELTRSAVSRLTDTVLGPALGPVNNSIGAIVNRGQGLLGNITG